MQPTINHVCPTCGAPLACTYPPGGQWECLSRDCGYYLIDLHGTVTTKEQLEAYESSGKWKRDLAAVAQILAAKERRTMDKLSRLIRVGALLRPQTIAGDYFEVCKDGSLTSCAIGAAYEACGGVVVRIGDELADIGIADHLQTCIGYNITEKRVAWPPQNNETDFDAPIATVLVHLNDSHEWTREAIADWLSTQGL